MLPLCACGCGEAVAVYSRHKMKFAKGHYHHITAKAVPLDECYSIDPKTGCWLWKRALSSTGYGRTTSRGARPAHRVLYERVNGPVPEGLELDHLCRTRHCVNPDHLEPVTHAENIRRGANAKLTLAQVREIRESNELQRVLAERYGVARTTVSEIRSGRLWRDAA